MKLTNLQNLLTVKSLVSMTLTLVFCYLAITGSITGDSFVTIFTMVISFYFGTQNNKGN